MRQIPHIIIIEYEPTVKLGETFKLLFFSINYNIVREVLFLLDFYKRKIYWMTYNIT
jgi:hypothetical protein